MVSDKPLPLTDAWSGILYAHRKAIMKPLILGCAVVAAVLTGCGHDDPDVKTSTITQPPVTVTNTPTSTVEVSPTETKVVQPTDTVTAPTQTVTETP